MRLTVPEPKIELYKDGFAKHDQLNRKETGDKLSDLVERIDDPLVIALDGAWGSGKSFFLKCWVGEHLKREGNTTQTVYFDAFQHDFLDDPLIALTGEIARRFEGNPSEGSLGRETDSEPLKALTKLKKFGLFLGKASGKAIISAGANYAKKAIGEDTFDTLGDELKEAIGDGLDTAENEAKALFDADWGEAASEDFWKEQRARTAAMEAFRLALIELTEPVTKEQAETDPKLQEGTPTRKLVIVIDELDRCRPDYALSLLEIIKHFFNVDGVHFVLGVNLTELQNSVRARYGNEVDAETYLQKFVAMRMTLNLSLDRHSADPIWVEHFQRCADKMEFPKEARALLKTTELILSRIKLQRDHSLRDVERVLTTLAAMPNLKSKFDLFKETSIGTMAVLKVILPNVYQKLRVSSEVEFLAGEHFNTSTEEYDRHSELIVLAWRAFHDFNALTTVEKEDLRKQSFSFGHQDWSSLLGKAANSHLEVFDFSDF